MCLLVKPFGTGALIVESRVWEPLLRMIQKPHNVPSPGTLSAEFPPRRPAPTAASEEALGQASCELVTALGKASAGLAGARGAGAGSIYKRKQHLHAPTTKQPQALPPRAVSVCHGGHRRTDVVSTANYLKPHLYTEVFMSEMIWCLGFVLKLTPDVSVRYLCN